MYVHDRIDVNERFRERRRRAQRRRRIRRAVAAAVLVGAVGGVAAGAAFFTQTSGPKLTHVAGGKLKPLPKPKVRPLPAEVRGVHVTMSLVSAGKLDEYLALRSSGLNTLEVDVKDESGEIAFASPRYAPLAVRIGAAKSYYEPRALVRKIHARGVYLIGRVVVFEDNPLAEARPELALKYADGSLWRNDIGLAWTNPYDKRVWDYNVGVATAAAKAGFDEIQFDYVRFPSDGNTDAIVYEGRRNEPKGATITRFLHYATKRLRPLGVRVSADLFGLAASHDLGIGQNPARVARFLDAIYPMVYPSHFYSGEYNLPDPNAQPGLTVRYALRDFKRQMRGRRAKVIPWLQDFSYGRTYTLRDVRDQVVAARQEGARGFLLWNAAGIYTRDALAPAGP